MTPCIAAVCSTVCVTRRRQLTCLLAHGVRILGCIASRNTRPGSCLPDGAGVAGRYVKQDVPHLQLHGATLEHQQPPHLRNNYMAWSHARCPVPSLLFRRTSKSYLPAGCIRHVSQTYCAYMVGNATWLVAVLHRLSLMRAVKVPPLCNPQQDSHRHLQYGPCRTAAARQKRRPPTLPHSPLSATRLRRRRCGSLTGRRCRRALS